MRTLRLFFQIFLLVFLMASAVSYSPSQKISRLPFQKKKIELQAPSSYEKRTQVDDQTKQEVEYDPKFRVEPIDIKSGKYALKWIADNGKSHTVIFQRPDAIDAILSASASKLSSSEYIYTYNVKNLPSSGQQLSFFALQTFAFDASPQRIGDGYVGQFSPNAVMNEGQWIGFGSTNFTNKVSPGKSIDLVVKSFAPPGLVECRIKGGNQVMTGTGVDIPGDLENILPGYQAWPSGYTIGPIEKLKMLSKPECAKYVIGLLPQFQKLGWMTAKASQQYAKILGRQDLEGAYKRAEQDLKLGAITTEVLSILQGLRMN